MQAAGCGSSSRPWSQRWRSGSSTGPSSGIGGAGTARSNGRARKRPGDCTSRGPRTSVERVPPDRPAASRSIGIILEYRFDRAAPGAMEFLQKFLGRGDVAGDIFLDRPQVPGLVAALGVEPPAALQPRLLEPE